MKYTVDTETKIVTIEDREVSSYELRLATDKYPDYTIILETKITFSPNQQVTVGDLCPCNPSRGGSGICGCTIANNPAWEHSITSNF